MKHSAASPYRPPSAREEDRQASESYYYGHLRAVARAHLSTSQLGAEQVLMEALGLDFDDFDRNRHLPDCPVLIAVASIYARDMRRADQLPQGVLDLDSYAFGLCTAMAPSLDKLTDALAERAYRSESAAEKLARGAV